MQTDKDRLWQIDDACHNPTVAQPNGVPEQHTFSVQTAPDGKAVLRKVDRHVLPIFFSLALLCSIDRGTKLLFLHSMSPILRACIMVILTCCCWCAANLSYAALQLNHDLHFSHTVYGFGSGDYLHLAACSVRSLPVS